MPKKYCEWTQQLVSASRPPIRLRYLRYATAERTGSPVLLRTIRPVRQFPFLLTYTASTIHALRPTGGPLPEKSQRGDKTVDRAKGEFVGSSGRGERSVRGSNELQWIPSPGSKRNVQRYEQGRVSCTLGQSIRVRCYAGNTALPRIESSRNGSFLVSSPLRGVSEPFFFLLFFLLFTSRVSAMDVCCRATKIDNGLEGILRCGVETGRMRW